MQTIILLHPEFGIRRPSRVGHMVVALEAYGRGDDDGGDDHMDEYYYYGLEPGCGYAGIA